ncbi:LysR family transcriptional regulator [Microbacterium sp.]|uniref:LysR family transcriptional regulator n=1 Tax=Microbacterium sp. TaxID=51671 RepID=UPI003A94BBAD
MTAVDAGDRQLSRLAASDLNLLVPLLALLQERSVTRAAARIGMSQPAVSHALRRLRLLLHDQLLVRQGGEMVLTPRAESLFAPVHNALHESARAFHPAPFDPSRDARTVTIALTTTTAFIVGPLLSAVIAERAPFVTLRMISPDMGSPTVFTDDTVDVVLLTEGMPSPHPRERLYDDRWVILASPQILTGLSPVELLAHEPHIRYETAGQRIRPYDILDQHRVPYRIRETVSDYTAIPYFLASSRRVALHRRQAAYEFERLLGLHVAEFPFPIRGLGIDLVWNPWLADDEFRRWLRAALRDAAAPLRRRYTASGYSPSA